MAELFSFASESDDAWSRLVAEIHEAVWKRGRLEAVQGFVRQGIAEFNHQEAENLQSHDDYSRKAEQLLTGGSERLYQHVLKCCAIEQTFRDELARISRITCKRESSSVTALVLPDELAKVNDRLCQHLCQYLKQSYRGRWVDVPCPPDLEPIGPRSNRVRSTATKWVVLAAIHDYYWPSEQISPWPREQFRQFLPTYQNEDDYRQHRKEAKKQFAEINMGLTYWKLVARVDEWPEARNSVIEGWWKELTVPSELPGDKPAKANGQTDSETDKSKKLQPENKDVAYLCRMLGRDLPKGKKAIDIALELTKDDRNKANNLLRQARRYRHLWQSVKADSERTISLTLAACLWFTTPR